MPFEGLELPKTLEPQETFSDASAQSMYGNFVEAVRTKNVEQAQDMLANMLKSMTAPLSGFRQYFSLMKHPSQMTQDNFVPVLEAAKSSSRRFRFELKDCLRAFPVEILTTLSLSEDTKKSLSWNVYLVSRALEECKNIDEGLDVVIRSDHQDYVSPAVLSEIIKSESDASKLVEILSQQQNCSENLHISALLTLVTNGFDSGAVEIWKSTNQTKLLQRPVLQDHAEMLQDFAQRHNFQYELAEQNIYKNALVQ